MPKALHPDVLRERRIATLQSLRSHAQNNRNFEGRKSGPNRAVYFRNYPTEVKKVAWECLNSLCIKHKTRLEVDPRFKGTLVATATRLALDKLGITQISRMGFHRLRHIRRLSVSLGIRENSGNYKRKGRKNAASAAKMQERNMPEISYI